MAITDAKITARLPPGARKIRKLSDGTPPTLRQVPAGPNLLSNPSFETNTSGWAAYSGATITRITSDWKTGAACLDMNQPAANGYAAAVTAIPVAPGVTYYFGGWVKKISGNNPGVALIFQDKASSFISEKTSPLVSATGVWTWVDATFTAPANAAFAAFYGFFGGTFTGQAYLDGAVLVPCAVELESPLTEPTATGQTAGGGVTYEPNAAAHHLADVAIYDMGAQTSGLLAASSYTRVYSRRHPFVGDVLVDNGLVRLWLKPYYDRYARARMSCFVNGEWDPFVDVGLDTGGDTTARIERVQLKVSSRNRAVILTRDGDGNVATLTLVRGSPFVRADVTRLVAYDTFMDAEIGSSSQRFFAYNAKTVLRDTSVASTQNVAGTSLTEPYALAWSPTLPYLCALAFPKKPTTLYADASPNFMLWRLTGSPALGTQRTFWFGLLAFPWLIGRAAFVEAESASTVGGTVTADAGASGGNVMRLDANGDFVYKDVTGGVDLPAGDYTLVARIKTSSAVSNDVRLLVKNETDAVDRASVIFTATTSYAYYYLDFSLTTADAADTVRLLASKQTGTAANVDVDYFVVIPRQRNSSSPDSVHFPRDMARNLLMQVTARESVRKA